MLFMVGIRCIHDFCLCIQFRHLIVEQFNPKWIPPAVFHTINGITIAFWQPKREGLARWEATAVASPAATASEPAHLHPASEAYAYSTTHRYARSGNTRNAFRDKAPAHFRRGWGRTIARRYVGCGRATLAIVRGCD